MLLQCPHFLCNTVGNPLNYSLLQLVFWKGGRNKEGAIIVRLYSSLFTLREERHCYYISSSPIFPCILIPPLQLIRHLANI